MSSRTHKIVNWGRSNMTELYLADLVDQGLLPPKEEIEWRAPEEERHLNPVSMKW